jgi:UPF0755 protein
LRLVWGILAVLLIAAAGSCVYSYHWLHSRPLAESDGVMLLIYPDESAADVARRVDSLGVFPSAVSFRLVSRLTGLDTRLQVGRYDIRPEYSRWQVIKLLEAAKSIPIRFTIPEGLTLKQILPILASALETNLADVERLAGDQDFLQSLGVNAGSIEGYLFPETYTVPWHSSSESVIQTVVGQLNKFLVDSLEQRMRQIGFTRHELLTFASLIESEARDGDERALISSVYHNRLTRHMLLQCDPTVIYALGGLDRPLLYKDLEIDSPYNTYKYQGLPPGPICSPGAASILAALYPADTDYLYFVADGTGGHIFTRTLEAHNKAKGSVKAKRGSLEGN